MTKSELIDAMAERTQLTKGRAEQVVNCIFDAMTEALERVDGAADGGFGDAQLIRQALDAVRRWQ